ncbi:hypothetical protein POL68_36165 [Stigmatella sp. ncwal1]|uniref:Uncharacterized protein n=1 Tax=Stigmatella ashevillensis TaxID=2995309 RepID=A0ABT5DMK4_9BACT|nr:hypothetical protein [Stigmatella ashevillena]MDC0713958.1 hypothetical protein [Stigmatella ashevillena]
MQTPPDTSPPRGAAILGRLLLAAAELPRQPTTEALLTQALLQADAPSFQEREFQRGLAVNLARARHPNDPEASQQDEAQWEALFSDPMGQQLFGDPRLSPAQRLANASFFLVRPTFLLELLSLYRGNLTSMAAHEAQLSLQAFEPGQVAPIARFPEALVPRFPELASLSRPVDAQALAVLIPHVLRPDQAAQLVHALADEILQTAQEDSPVKEHRRALASAAAEGLRELEEPCLAESAPQQVAQFLVLAALQHQCFFQNLPAFTEEALARQSQPSGVSDSVALGFLATAMGHLGMALGGPVGSAVARMITQSACQTVEGLRTGERLPLGALSGEVLGIPGLGLAPHALGEVAAALTQLYASQLAQLGDDTASLLGPLAPLLFQGEVEGLGAAWTHLLTDPERMEEFLGADASLRAEVLRILLVGGTVGAFAWETVVPALHAQSQIFLGYSLPAETPAETLSTLYAASAARAVAVLGNDELIEAISSANVTPAEALAESQGRGAGLFAGGLAPGEPALTAALLGGMAPTPSTFAPSAEDTPDGAEG